MRRYISWFLCILFILLFNEISIAQRKKVDTALPKETQSKVGNPNIIRWKIYLDSLAQEARSISPEERRPYAITEVANAYWEFDRETSRSMYVLALDSAWSSTQKVSKNRSPLNYVLSAAAKRDSNLAKLLTDRLIDKEDTGDKDDISSTVALELLKTDSKKAAQLVEAFAPNGLQSGMANFFIFRLAAKDVDLANHLHIVYLNKVASNENLPLEWLISLGGYSFGYTEFYSIDKKGQLFGATFPQIKDFSTNSSLAKPYLDLAFNRIAKIIKRRNNASGAEIESLNYGIIFAVEYLMPEVAKFSPNTLASWQQLQQEGTAGVTVQQLEQIAIHMQSINQSRERLKKYEEPSQTTVEREIDESLEKAEKIIDACQRDVIYSKAAISYSSRNNFKRALEIVSKVSNLNQADSLKEIILFDNALVDIKSETINEINDKTKKISSPELLAILHAKLIEDALGRKDEIAASNFTDDEQKIVNKLSDENIKSGFLFNLAAMLIKSQKSDGQIILRDAIKSLNKQESKDNFDFSVPVKISLSCSGNDDNWYGGSISLPNSNLFETIELYAKRNPDQAVLIADEISDKIVKLRINSIIAKIALINELKNTAKNN